MEKTHALVAGCTAITSKCVIEMQYTDTVFHSLYLQKTKTSHITQPHTALLLF